jgi:hypothetical protein
MDKHRKLSDVPEKDIIVVRKEKRKNYTINFINQ